MRRIDSLNGHAREVAGKREVIKIGRLRRDRGMSVARPTALGNPFVVGKPYRREESIARYRDWLASAIAAGSPNVLGQLERIIEAARVGDVTLLCHCAPLSCHAQVVAEYVEHVLAAESRDCDLQS